MHTPHDPLTDPELLACMSPSLRALARQGEQRFYKAGQPLIMEGGKDDTIFVVLRGRVQAFCTSPHTGQVFVFNTYGPGEYVGEMSLDGGPRSASVHALEPVMVAVITKPLLTRHLEADPSFVLELLAKVISRARVTTATAAELVFNDVYGRIKALLERQSSPLPDGRRIVMERLTHQEIANRCGCTREMVTRIMKHLQPHYVQVADDKTIELRVFPLPAGL